MSDTHDHPIRGRFHAWFLSTSENAMHRLFGARKSELFASLPERVVEIGPGTGANFLYYPPGTEVVGIEPNVLPTTSPRLRGANEPGMESPGNRMDHR